MTITIKLYASLRYGRFASENRTCTEPPVIRDIIAGLGIPFREIGIVLRNGLHASADDVANDGDVISLMPKIGGG